MDGLVVWRGRRKKKKRERRGGEDWRMDVDVK
jgi:hypothetical protein